MAFSSTESVPPRAVAPVPTVMVLPSATATFSFNVVAPSTTIAPVVFNEPVNFTLSALSISNLTFVFTSSVLVWLVSLYWPFIIHSPIAAALIP